MTTSDNRLVANCQGEFTELKEMKVIRKLIPGLMVCCIVTSILFAACTPSPTVDKPATINPITYQPKDIDDARHELPPGEAFEWWYFDASFDNGYSMVMSWQMANMKLKGVIMPFRVIQFAIYDPQGNKTAKSPMFRVDDYNASNTSCDVTMGSNHLQGNYPRYDIDFLEKDLGCKLSFENLTQGFRNPPDGVTYFSREPDRYMGWVIAQPKAKVTGKLILNGNEIPVTGAGYHDHNWGNTRLPDLYNFWYWGRILNKDYTFVYSVGETSATVGSRPISAIVAFKGHDLVDLSDKLYADTSDLALDTLTGINYPKTLILRVESPITKGIVTHKVKNLVESALTPEAVPGGGRGYLRFLSDCDIRLNVSGEKIETEAALIHEYMKP